jgi:histidine triad (HIT) family protein
VPERYIASMDCLFCAIIAGDIPSRRVYEDDRAVAFLDISPWKRGHTLVVPRRHVNDVLAGDEALSEIAPAITATSRLLTERLGADGLNLLSSAGAVAGQEVFHLHVHLVPRYTDDAGLRRLFQRDESIDLDEVFAAISRS